MKNLLNLLNNHFYLDAILKELPESAVKGIPLGIKSQYKMHVLQINQVDCLLLEANQPSVIALRKHLDMFDQILHMPSLLYIPTMKSSMQHFLLENKIAFATKDSFYFPQLLICLQDTSPKESRLKKAKKLSKLAQMILTYTLITRTCKIEIDDYATHFGVTTMSVGRALHELYLFDLLELKVLGRKKIYKIASKISFEAMIQSLKNPCSDVVYIHAHDLNKLEPNVNASYMALSHYANLVSTQRVFAIEKERFYRSVKNDKIAYFDECYDHALVSLELWQFDPTLIQKTYADPLSLYLTLQKNQESEESRIQDALLELVDQIQGLINDTRTC